jgi:hypothetical protein
MASLSRISGVGIFENKKEGIFRSGICHHMVIVQAVLEDLINSTEARYQGLPFWQVYYSISHHPNTPKSIDFFLIYSFPAPLFLLCG